MKLMDKIISYCIKFILSIVYLTFTFVFSLLFIGAEVWALAKCNISFKVLASLQADVVGSIILFILVSCGAIILVSEGIIWFMKLGLENADVVYYEFIDNLYKFLAVWGVLIQIASLTSGDITDKISTAVLLGIVIGLQQIGLKIWFKTMRNSEAVNIIQSIDDLFIIYKYKERLKPTVEAMRMVRPEAKLQDRRSAVKNVCDILCEKRFLKSLNGNKKKYRNTIEALESAELKRIFNTFYNKEKSSSEHLNAGIVEIEKIAENLGIKKEDTI